MGEALQEVGEKPQIEIDPLYDAPVLADYRPFSPLALVALLLSVISWFAIISPLLWILPLIGLIISIFAVRHTTIGERPPLGRKAALLALVMSVFLLGYAPANYITSRSILCAQARAYSDAWIELIRRGELGQAHQLHLTFYDRIAPGTDLKKHYEQRFPSGGTRMRQQMGVNDPYGEMEEFFGLPPLKDMATAGEKGKYEYLNVRMLPDETKRAITMVEVQYRFTYPDKDGMKTIPLHIKLKCATLNTGNRHWNVEVVQNPWAPRSSMERLGM